MEVPWHNLFSDMDMEEDGNLLNQCQDSLEDQELVLREILQHSANFSSESATGSSLSFEDNINNKGGKLLSKSNSSSSIVSCNVPDKPATANSPTPCVLSFDDSPVPVVAAITHTHQTNGQRRDKAASSEGANLTRKGRSSSDSLDHIMAERKRRQELTERFIALSAIIPGLKKIDKASILSEAISYVKQLQKSVKELEEQSSKRIKVESASFVNKSHLYTADEGTVSSYKTNSDDCHRLNVVLPEVEARILEKQVLIRIHCNKHNGVMLKIMTHLRSLDLSTVSNSVLPFGNSVLDITIIAQMGDKYNITVKDLVKNLKLALLQSADPSSLPECQKMESTTFTLRI